MVKSISAKLQKRGPGRPATGRDPMIGLRAGEQLTAAIDAWAKRNGVGRSEAIRRLVEIGLAGGRAIPVYRASGDDAEE
jgi:Ribbon-helix-helix protein, copG family